MMMETSFEHAPWFIIDVVIVFFASPRQARDVDNDLAEGSEEDDNDWVPRDFCITESISETCVEW